MSRTAPSHDERDVVRQAAQWLALLESGDASEADQRQLQHWRDSDGRHERAWQKAQQLRQRFSGLPTKLAMATLDRPDHARRAALKRALGLAIVAPAAWLAWRELPIDVWRADLQTATGEQKRWNLADGIVLQLNTASAANIDMTARRLTLLRGEMALKVPGMSPLIVDGPYGRIVVSQSEACVRLDDDRCRVQVVNGSVQLQPLNGPVLTLRSGEQVILQRSGAGAVSSFDASLHGWRDGVLSAQNQPLGHFLRELGRYRAGVLRWEPALEALRVTGSFRLDNTDRILALLAATLPVEVHSRTRYWVTIVPRQTPSTKNNA
ncbi:FecR domain-containing protein [Pseudomonas sp. NPDC088444]|uniref:FecR domain-containing protein n=1 Tax=Pseudomonas sp. NPDC088444 TaxID=3364456 RepID=UPI00384ED746